MGTPREVAEAVAGGRGGQLPERDKERAVPHLRSAQAVTGSIQATDGDIGHVEDFLVDDQAWTIRYMLVDTTNWWAGKKVLVAPAWIQRMELYDHYGVPRYWKG